jgi:Spy/CpxP family protein refolding chaperone
MDINSPNRKAIALLFLVLVLGIALGAVATTVVNRRVYGARLRVTVPGTDMTRPVARLTHDLSLTPDQVKQVSGILNDMQSKYDGIRQQIGPQIEDVRQRGREQIREVLTPEQRPKFEEYLSGLDADRRRRDAR